MTLKEAVNALKEQRCYTATVAKYGVHLRTCKELEVDPDTFEHFAEEILSTPKAMRGKMLEVEELEPYVPFMSYPAYVEPIMAEQKLDFYSAAMGRKLR